RLRKSLRIVGKVEGVTSFNTQKIAVDAALVAIISANDFHASLGPAHAQRSFAAVGAVGAGRTHVGHFPGTGLISIRSGSQRAHRANIDAHAALFALQMVFVVRSDDRTYAAVLHPQRPDIHSLAAHAHTAIAKNAAWPVEVHHRRPLLL